MPTFGNPLGLLALLGIPAVLAIHFLQRKAKRLPVSTLFLLDQAQRKSASGRNFERLQSSPPMWLQLLAILLLTWLLADPRLARPGSVCRLAVVVDSSASMQVFLPEVVRTLEKTIPEIQGQATSLEITLLESAPHRPRLYTGASTRAALESLAAWLPCDGPTDPTIALRLARSLVSREGAVIYLSDTPAESPLPEGARWLSVGAPVENVGFTGVSFAEEQGATVWQAMVKNHGTHRAERQWRFVSDSGATTPTVLILEPGAVVTLQAAWPANTLRARVELSPDPFSMDDVLPLVPPRPKHLRAALAPTMTGTDLGKRLLQSMDAVEMVNPPGNDVDFRITAHPPGALDGVLGNAIIWLERPTTAAGPWQQGGIVAESHPLMDGLNWQSLLFRAGPGLEPGPSDKILLWREKSPLAWLQSASDRASQLVLNLDPSQSNLSRQSALIVLTHRFAESLRARKVAPSSVLLETGQPIALATLPAQPVSMTVTTPDGRPLPQIPTGTDLQAPRQPSFLQIKQDDTLLLNAAVYFADPREADFTRCAPSAIGPITASLSTSQAFTRADPFRHGYLLALVVALVLSWWFGRVRNSR